MTNPIHRHPIRYDDADYLNEESLYAELERVFELCHGCRRCFNLCDSFPTLFDLIDEMPNGTLEEVDKTEYRKVADSCTLCDLCYNIKCPYVPPHEWDIDFPKLMLRHKAFLRKNHSTLNAENLLAQTDIAFSVAQSFSKITNKVLDKKNTNIRSFLSKTMNIHRQAHLPTFHSETLLSYAKKNGFQQKSTHKVVVFATCLANYSEVEIGKSALNVLKKLGVQAEIVYPECCGMPLFESGNVQKVAEKALKIAKFFEPYLQNGYQIISLIPSCSLMLKKEWPLLHPEDENIFQLADATLDLSEAVVYFAQNKKELFESVEDQKITVHLACHARAQNNGPKAVQMLRLVKGLKVKVIDRCSGHGGSFGMKNDTYEIAKKVGKPVVQEYTKAVQENGECFVISECPLAGRHIQNHTQVEKISYQHPIQILEKFLK